MQIHIFQWCFKIFFIKGLAQILLDFFPNNFVIYTWYLFKITHCNYMLWVYGSTINFLLILCPVAFVGTKVDQHILLDPLKILSILLFPSLNFFLIFLFISYCLVFQHSIQYNIVSTLFFKGTAFRFNFYYSLWFWRSNLGCSATEIQPKTFIFSFWDRVSLNW